MYFGSSRLLTATGRSHRRRLAAVVVAGSTLIAGVGVAGLAVASPAGAATKSSGSSSSSSAACPTAASGSGEVAFKGTMSNTTATLGSSAKMTGLNGTLCGLVDLGTLTASIAADNFDFSSATTSLLGLMSLPTTVKTTSTATATLTPGANSTFDTSMQVSMEATTSILGLFTCNIGPFSPTMTTGTSGSVSGTPLSGSLLQSLSGTLAAGTFSVPDITPSSSCPSIVAGMADLLVGLPLASGKSTITSTVTLTPELSS